MKNQLSGDFVIWGARGHFKVLRSVIGSHGANIVAVVDNDEMALQGVENAVALHGLAGLESFLLKRADLVTYGAIAVGGGRASDRLSILHMFRTLKLLVPPIVDHSVVIEAGSVISDGCQLLAGSILGADAALGEACILNHNVVVDHECIIGRGVHIAPNATICGCVEVGDGAFIGAGATILPRIQIGANAIVGAGAVVTRNVEPGHIVVGIPASELNTHRKVELR